MKLIFVFICVLSIISCSDRRKRSNFDKSFELSERIDLFLEKAKDSSADILQSKAYLDSAYNFSAQIESDSTKQDYFTQLSYKYYKLKEFTQFKKLNKIATELSLKIKDSNDLALNYWDLANYYFHHQFVMDSAYYHYYNAQQLYDKIGNDFNAARMLLRMAICQKNAKDYVGSETTTTKAIVVFKDLNKYIKLSQCFNNLGIVNNELGNYNDAIDYHNQSLEYRLKVEVNPISESMTLNNVGVIYRNQEEYNRAIENFSTALKQDSLYQKNTKLYAVLLDNLTYSNFKLGNVSSTLNDLNEAVRINDSINNISGITTNKIHLSEYYAVMNDTFSAYLIAKEANELAIEYNNNEDLLDSYLLLAELDKEKGVEYAKMHIALNDSLQKEERRIRNKFARIQFETKEIADRNVQLSKQRYWITGLLVATIIVALLGYIVFSQRSRNKVLEFERMQQRANEEIYNLMLSQQTKLEEGSQREKKRISEELHDGVLGRMFGTRLTLGSLNDKDDAESKKTRQLYLEELKSIEEEVRGISHELSTAMFNSERSYISMVSELLERQSTVTGFDYTVDSDYSIDWDYVSGNMKINIYRIIQEAIQNINKYAHASKVIINFEKIENSFVLSIKDDGVGFDTTVKKKGIGLKNIRSRVVKLGGEAKITSEKNIGTSIQIQVPFKIILKNEETV